MDEKTKKLCLRRLKENRDLLILLESPFGHGLVESAREPGQTHTIDDWTQRVKAEIEQLEILTSA